MYQLRSGLIVGVVILGLAGGLASCGGPQTSAPAASASPTTAPTTTAMKPAASGFVALQSVVANTKAAVEAGDFEKGKTEFAKFEDAWKTVEDGVKAKSSDTYTAIEEGMDKVNEGLKGKNKAAVLTGLKDLGQGLARATKS